MELEALEFGVLKLQNDLQILNYKVREGKSKLECYVNKRSESVFMTTPTAVKKKVE